MGLGFGFASKMCRRRKRLVQRSSGESTSGFRYHEVKNDGKKNALVIGQIA